MQKAIFATSFKVTKTILNHFEFKRDLGGNVGNKIKYQKNYK